MKSSKKVKKIILGVIVTIPICTIIVSGVLEYCVYRNNYPSVLSNKDWASFFGSFLGGAIGGAVTLVAVYITIEGTRKENIELKNERNRSFLDTFLIKSSNGMLDDFKEEYQVQDVKVIIDDNYETLIRNDTTLIRQKGGVKFIGITNCGPALIKDIKVNIKNKNNTVKENFVSRILVNELFFIPIVFEKSHEIDTPIDTIEITYKTLVDEIIIVNKKFYDENTYNEEINITKNYNYGYKKTKCKFTKLKTF